jgi:hypothetical protein
MSNDKFEAMGKLELRAACKEAGVENYGKMNNDGMREALRVTVAPVEQVEVVAPAATGLGNAFAQMIDPKGFAKKMDDAARSNGAKTRRVVDGKEVTTKPAPVKSEPRARVEKTPAPFVAKVDRKGYTIQKEREEQNGVKRPSAGTVCGAVWAAFDANPAVKAGELNGLADANGWNRTNVSCEFYAWRKFMGIKGRAAK